MDGYNGYNEVKMVEEDKRKTVFILEWGAYAYNVMPFGLCNVPITFQKVVTKNFNKYFNDFMQVFLDDFNVFGENEDHLDQLYKCLEECRINSINLNLRKCAFCVTSRVFLSHIVCSERLLVDLRKIEIITKMPTPTNVTKIK
jgi:hypothetical protein